MCIVHELCCLHCGVVQEPRVGVGPPAASSSDDDDDDDEVARPPREIWVTDRPCGQVLCVRGFNLPDCRHCEDPLRCRTVTYYRDCRLVQIPVFRQKPEEYK